MDSVRLIEERLPGLEPVQLSILAAAATTTGPVRPENQDAVVVGGMITQQPGRVLSCADAGASVFVAAVIDGMGGPKGGREAALFAASRIANLVEHPHGEPFSSWVDRTSGLMTSYGRLIGMPDMGAAFALVALTREGVLIANVGDCRVYRAVDGYCSQLSVDDRSRADSSALSQALGSSGSLDAHALVLPYVAGAQRFVLCCDGVWESLDDGLLAALLAQSTSPSEAVEALLGECEEKMARDNCSVVVIDAVAC